MRNTILGLWLTMPFCLLAQTPHPWEIGAGAGISAYNGETNSLKLGQKLGGLHAGFALHARKNLGNHFSARINLLYTEISGNDKHLEEPAWRKIRGLSFQSPLFEFSALTEIYPLGLYKKRRGRTGGLSNARRAIAPFFAIGIGATWNKPKVNWNDETTNEYLDPVLAKVDKDHSQKIDFSIPMGLGIRFRATDRLTLGLESFVSPTLNDYLDGISVSGNPGQNDWFVSAQATASYAFGESPKSSHGNSPSEDKLTSPDSDGDDVPDDHDDCPETPGFRYLKGCPDTDRDGVADKEDLCPEAAGLPTLGGCPDKDEDGIPDKDDNCPEIKGVAAYRGCPAVDRDKDGVADAEDLCPDMNGQLRWKGCPDSDSDGLPDNKDACPGIAGPENLRGCPDTDEDGISDKEDECPTLAGIAAKKGCPESLPPAPGVPYKAVYFGSTLKDWHSTSVITLDEVVVILLADPALFARLEGHTDNTGKEPANDLLAEHRAKKCLDYLVATGIEQPRLNYLGYGSHKPIVPNDTRSNRQLNRRVEVHFYRKQ